MQSIIESTITSPLFDSKPLSKLIAEYATPTEFGIIMEKIYERTRIHIDIPEEEIISSITNFQPLSFELQRFFSEMCEEARDKEIAIKLKEILLEKMTNNLTKEFVHTIAKRGIFSRSFQLEKFDFFCFLCGSPREVISRLKKKEIGEITPDSKYVSRLIQEIFY